MPQFSEPFSVPDDLADGWDDMVRRNRLIQALNDPGFADDDQETTTAPDDLVGQLRQAQMPLTDWLSVRSDQLAQAQPSGLAATGHGDDSVGARQDPDQLIGSTGADTIDAPETGAYDAKRAAARELGASHILDLVPQGEGTAGANGYDMSYNNADGKHYPAGWKKPTELTVDQAIQMKPDLQRASGGDVLGKYQFTPQTLGYLKGWMNLDGSETMTPSLQDRMGRELLNQRGYDKFLSGALSAEDLQKNLAKEWSSLAEDGRDLSHYAKDGHAYLGGPNSVPARVKTADIQAAIKAAGDTFNQAIDEGHMPPLPGGWREPSKTPGDDD